MTIPSVSDRFIIDSSGWLEYLGNGQKADRFAPYIESQAVLFLPAIVVYEVHKKLTREQSHRAADDFLSFAFSFGDRLIPLTLELAIIAAGTSLDTGLPMACAIIYATAQHQQAQLLTTDSHFVKLPRVTLI